MQSITASSTTSAGVSGLRDSLSAPPPPNTLDEEDESTETGSEGVQEPLTPIADSLHNAFHHHDGTVDQIVSLSKSNQETPKPLHDPSSNPPLYTSQPPISSMQSHEGNNEDRRAIVPALDPISPISTFSPTEAPQSSESTNSDPRNESSVSVGSPEATNNDSLNEGQLPNSSENVQNATEPPKKEPLSLYDVPPGWRKSSPDRGRQKSGQDERVDSKNGSLATIRTSRKSPSPEKPNQGIPKTSTDPARPETPKRGVIMRANTFLSKLKRTPSSRVDELSDSNILNSSQGQQSGIDASKPTSAADRKSSIPISRSARNTPSTSTSHTPPSPGSLTSTISEANEEDALKQVTTTGGHSHSRSAAGLGKMNGPRSGITWIAPHSGSQLRPSPEVARKRSASTDQIPRIAIRKPNEQPDPDTPNPANLLPTFSKHANEGTGLKARRLSTSLPDKFYVDYCELNNEYKSSKLFARRGKTIGKGATAEVTIMTTKGGSKEDLVAVKEFRGREKDEDEAEYVKKVKSEYTIARSLHHPNIVETLRLCTHAGRWNHVMEYCEVGDVYSLVEKGLFKHHYKVEDRLCFFKQVLRAVDYLHSHGIAHRDIKLENLLMTQNGCLKLTDFGVSEVFSGEHPGLRASGGECGKNMGAVRRCTPGICGSLPYIAPEVLAKNGDYDPRPLDVWSCAIMYITMQFGGPPWHVAKMDQDNYRRFTEGWNKWLADHPSGEITNEEGGWPKCGPLFAYIEPPPLRRVLLKMLHPDPEKRIAVKEILTKSFLKSQPCCTPENYEESNACCGIDAQKGRKGSSKGTVLPKHSHLPPKEHKTPKALQHRFDMGHGWN